MFSIRFSILAILFYQLAAGPLCSQDSDKTQNDAKVANDGTEKDDGQTKIRVLFSDKPVSPAADLPKEARQGGGKQNHDGAFSMLVAGSVTAVTVTYFDTKTLKEEKDVESFLSRLLTTPKGSTFNHIPWAQGLNVPTVAATVSHNKGEPGIWLVWDADQSVYCAYKDGEGRWWFGVWFMEEIPR